jgi:hypothetical protein
MDTKNGKRGYIALLAVIMIATAGLFLAVTASLAGISELQSSLSLTNGENTLNFVEGCAEDALQKVWASPSYLGGNITRPEGTCTVTVTTAGQVYTLTVSTSATDYSRTIQVVVNRGASAISIVSWKEM